MESEAKEQQMAESASLGMACGRLRPENSADDHHSGQCGRNPFHPAAKQVPSMPPMCDREKVAEALAGLGSYLSDVKAQSDKKDRSVDDLTSMVVEKDRQLWQKDNQLTRLLTEKNQDIKDLRKRVRDEETTTQTLRRNNIARDNVLKGKITEVVRLSDEVKEANERARKAAEETMIERQSSESREAIVSAAREVVNSTVVGLGDKLKRLDQVVKEFDGA